MTYAALETGARSGKPVELYLFQLHGQRWLYTSADTPQTYNLDTYEPQPIRRTSPEQQKDPGAHKLQVTVPRDNEVALLFRIFVPPGAVMLTIFRRHRGDSETVVAWAGRVRSVKWGDTEAYLECEPTTGQMKRDALRLQYQVQCNHMLYGGACGVNRVSFQVVATLTQVAGTTIKAAAFATRANGWFKAGLLVHGYDQRMITSHAGDTITVLTPFEDLAAGETVTAYAGCDRSFAVCKDRFANTLNFGGFPWIPTKNPFNGIG